ncbi:hypothetical protein ACLPHM_09455 [Paenalcaligenes sp. Me131]|jgi:hypothetical protein
MKTALHTLKRCSYGAVHMLWTLADTIHEARMRDPRYRSHWY